MLLIIKRIQNNFKHNMHSLHDKLLSIETDNTKVGYALYKTIRSIEN